MSRLIYEVTEDIAEIDGAPTLSYGIAVYEDTDMLLHIRKIPDVSVRRDVVEIFALLCNELQLSLDHIDEAIEDLLAK